MPELDRRISITFDTGGSSQGGEYAPANVTVNRWATLRALDATRELEAGGARPSGFRTYRIRYDARILEAFQAARVVSIVDGGFRHGAVNIAEPEGERRRWLDVTAGATQ